MNSSDDFDSSGFMSGSSAFHMPRCSLQRNMADAEYAIPAKASHDDVRSRKKRKQKDGVVISFNEDARRFELDLMSSNIFYREFLTGFRTRKQERRKKAQEDIKKREHKILLEKRALVSKPDVDVADFTSDAQKYAPSTLLHSNLVNLRL